MNEMTLRELDGEISRLVYGMRFEAIPKRTEKSFHGCFVNEASRLMGKAVKYDQGICIGSFESSALQKKSLADFSPRFSTDPAASHELLKRCAEKCNVEIGCEVDTENDGSQSIWFWVQCNDIKGSYAEAETLEHAVALFALKLWEK
jgi:hypothetical protein